MTSAGRKKDLTFQQLLNEPVKELNLRPDGVLRACLIQMRRELYRARISFFPHFYFGEEPWGCIDGTGSVEIPFYLANRKLWKLADRYYLSYSKREVMMLLRHETGHAVNYVYKLWRREEWRELFGNFRERYPNMYNYDAQSKDFVRYLHFVGNPHYAQKHPDDDFAETFAVWLDPSTKWKWNYRDWPRALEKLRYVDRLFRREKTAVRRPRGFKESTLGDYRKIGATVAEYFAIEEMVDPRIKEYTANLRQMFRSKGSIGAGAMRADRFIQNYSEYLEEELVTWIPKAKRRDVRPFVKELQTICAINDLHLRPAEAPEKIIELVIVATLGMMKRLKMLK